MLSRHVVSRRASITKRFRKSFSIPAFQVFDAGARAVIRRALDKERQMALKGQHFMRQRNSFVRKRLAAWRGRDLGEQAAMRYADGRRVIFQWGRAGLRRHFDRPPV